MNIAITPEAREYISRQGTEHVITIDLAKRSKGSCAGRTTGDGRYPSVRPGPVGADEAHRFVCTAVDGVTVYYREGLAGLYGSVTVKLDKLFSYEALVAIGGK